MDEQREAIELCVERLRLAGVTGVITSPVEQLILRDGVQKTRCVVAVRHWITTTNEGVLGLLGVVGCGKTVACVDLLASLRGRYVTARRLERIFSANWGPDRDRQDEYCGARLLVIDDLGRERDLLAFEDIFTEIIDARQGGGCWTIFTANLTGKQFFDRYSDPRLLRRLKTATIITDKGPDLTGGEA